MLVRFWGVRGSVPAPLTHADLIKKVRGGLDKFTNTPLTYGGNTSCVEVRCGDHIIVLDMGTGLRPLGNALFPEMMKNKGLNVTFLISHVHWDHIHGLPFFGPLYVNKATGIENSWSFYGGNDWQKSAEICLRGQMDPPHFPVSFEEIEKMTHKMHFEDVFDMKSFKIGDDGPTVACRKLNHPQETYGWRIEHGGKVLVYATDNEPWDPKNPDKRLLDLARNADLLIIDCQYTQDIYNGKVGGVARHGWGHSYPEAVAATARLANVKSVALFHHDPGSTDADIAAMEKHTQELLGFTSIAVAAAWEGMQVEF